MNNVSYDPHFPTEPQRQPVLEERLIQEQDFQRSIIISGQDALIASRIVATGDGKLRLYGKGYFAEEAEPNRSEFLSFGGGQEWCFRFDNENIREMAVAYLNAQGEVIQTAFSVSSREEARILPAQKKVFEPPDEAKSIQISFC